MIEVSENFTGAVEISDRVPTRDPRALDRLFGLLGIVLSFGLWQLAATFHWISTFFISSPISVAKLLEHWAVNGAIAADVFTTGEESVVGLLLGILIGVILAVILYSNGVLRKTFFPLLTVLMGLPRVVLAPLFLIWFGIGIMSKVWLVVSVVSLIVFFSTFAGLTETDVQLIAKTRMLGASRSQIYIHVIGPSVVTWIMSSIRTSMGIAITAAVVGEYIGSTRGLGYLIANAQGNLDSTGVFAGLVLTGLLVLLVEIPVGRIERYFGRWKAALGS